MKSNEMNEMNEMNEKMKAILAQVSARAFSLWFKTFLYRHVQSLLAIVIWTLVGRRHRKWRLDYIARGDIILQSTVREILLFDPLRVPLRPR